jgi:hypothetical protein
VIQVEGGGASTCREPCVWRMDSDANHLHKTRRAKRKKKSRMWRWWEARRGCGTHSQEAPAPRRHVPMAGPTAWGAFYIIYFVPVSARLARQAPFCSSLLPSHLSPSSEREREREREREETERTRHRQAPHPAIPPPVGLAAALLRPSGPRRAAGTTLLAAPFYLFPPPPLTF